MDEFYQKKLNSTLARQDFENKLNYVLSKSDNRKSNRFTNMNLSLWIVGVFCLLLSVFEIIFFSNNFVSAKPKYNMENQGINAALIIDLGKKVKNFESSNIELYPKISGYWSIKRGMLLETDKIIFNPAEYFTPNTSYKIKEIKLYNIISGEDNIAELNFTTEPAIGLKNSGILTLKDDDVIPADYQFELSLRYTRDLDIKTTPAIEFIKQSKGDNLSWIPKTKLKQGSSFKLDVWDNSLNKIIYTKNINVAPQPSININKESDLVLGDVVQITFSEPIINKLDNLIYFEANGEGSWISDAVYSYKLTDVLPGSKYKYVLKSGIKTHRGGVLENDIQGYLNTVGQVAVISSSPQGNDLSQSSQTLSFTFNQPVDKESVLQRFNINAGKIESTSWQDNTFYAKIVNIGYQKNVVATISPGVKNSGFGLPSDKAFYNSFTTETRLTKYNVPFYRQQYKASCAAASLRMILAFRGIRTNDLDIVYRMGYNPRPIDNSTSPPSWDDPDEMFVGDINGNTRDGTAAGPNALPIVKAAQSFGRSAYRGLDVNTEWISQQLSSGRLVIGFGAIGSSNKYIDWRTPSGRIETTNIRGHAITIIGFNGEPTAPIGFWFNDPLSSGTQYWTNSELKSYIKLDPTRQAVAVE